MIGISKKPRVILQHRDRTALAVLGLAQIAAQQQLAVLSGFLSRTRASARLTLLTKAGYLARDYLGTIAGGRRAIYYLPGKGIRSRRGPAGFAAAANHQLQINEVRCALHIGSKQHRFEYEWGGLQAVDSSLIPDARIIVTASTEQHTWLLEADCGTEGSAIWRGKVERYLLLAQRTDLPELLGASRFRVLVVLPTERRLEQIKKVVAAKTEKVFWLTTFQSLISDGFFAPIWLRPNGATRLPLIKEQL